jgi:hypothetical protein
MTITVEEAMGALSVVSFRGKQKEAVGAVLSGSDVLYVFPTGCGKVPRVSGSCVVHRRRHNYRLSIIGAAE